MARFWVNDLGTIREAVKIFVNDAGTVRELTRLWALDGSTPRLVFELISGITPTPGTPIDGNENTEQACVSDFDIPAGSVLLVPSDFWLWSDDTAEPGLCIDVENITVMNQGNIIGRGGDAGANGGPALFIDACGCTVVNASGAFIAGGGGGGKFRTTNLGRGWSVGGGGGAGGGRGGNGSQSASGVTGGAINATGGQGAEAGGQPGSGQQGAGGGGGRILPGVSSVGGSGTGGAGGQDGTNGGGGGWGAAGGDTASGGSQEPGDGGPAIISSAIWNGVTNNGTIFGQVAPLIGSGVPIGGLFHHQEITLSSLCVNDGDTVTFPADFFIWSDDTSVPALTIDVDNVTINNNGSIIGAGGAGGTSVGGTDGGDAINVTATGVVINNTSTGFIAGGGGGGRGRVVNSGRGTSNGGGGGAGGGRGGAGTSSNSFTISFGGAIGQAGSGGSETGGSGNSGTNYGSGGGRVTPGADYTPAAGGGGGWGQGGLDANGNEISSGGAAISGNSVTGTNAGEVRGDGAILQEGTFLSQVYTSSGTVSLTGTGPGWVFLTGGGGSGGAFIHVTTQPQAGPGGTGGLAGMFLDDLADIDGVSFTLGAGGPGRNVNGSGNDSNPGNAGGTSSLSGGGVTLSATGGGGGGEINFAAGAAGVGTPAGDVQDARDYWADFLVDGVAGDTLVAVGGGTAGAAANLVSPAGVFASITSGAGGAGQLTIIYQDQS